MNKKVFTHTIMSIPLMSFVIISYAAKAMQNDSREREKNEISFPVPPQDQDYTPEKLTKSPNLKTQIQAEVQRILKKFQDNMNAYYKRTGNPKRLTIRLDQRENAEDVDADEDEFDYIPSRNPCPALDFLPGNGSTTTRTATIEVYDQDQFSYQQLSGSNSNSDDGEELFQSTKGTVRNIGSSSLIPSPVGKKKDTVVSTRKEIVERPKRDQDRFSSQQLSGRNRNSDDEKGLIQSNGSTVKSINASSLITPSLAENQDNKNEGLPLAPNSSKEPVQSYWFTFREFCRSVWIGLLMFLCTERGE
jgi:hypothetical protein